jgi:hypothetical protein
MADPPRHPHYCTSTTIPTPGTARHHRINQHGAECQHPGCGWVTVQITQALLWSAVRRHTEAMDAQAQQ